MIRVNRDIIRNVILVPLLAGLGGTFLLPAQDSLLIDDFSSDRPAIGTRWEGFSDRVMGGVSDMTAGYDIQNGERVLRMAGTVSLANNGGFIQVRLPLGSRGAVDASEYSGIAIEAKGLPGFYYFHLRTRSSRRPWQYYSARLDVSSEWTRIEVPFNAFEAQSTRSALDATELVSIAVVGGTQEFDADISVRRIEFYQ